MAERERGIVKWFNNEKGYGFIQRAAASDVFVHYTNIEGEGHRSLVEGQGVSFNVAQGPKGTEAEKVRVEADEALGQQEG